MYLSIKSFSDMSNRTNLNKSSPATRAYQEPTPGPRQQHRKDLAKSYVCSEDTIGSIYTENLGRMAAALIPKVQTDELKCNPFKIVCAGLTLLVAGFLKVLQRANITFDINLVQLKKSSTFGACTALSMLLFATTTELSR
uniref:Uncharacterized protein n=1 Tax=Glossina austeni TaxID=7395 RepID=A0A1A9V153_GLOAU